MKSSMAQLAYAYQVAFEMREGYAFDPNKTNIESLFRENKENKKGMKIKIRNKILSNAINTLIEIQVGIVLVFKGTSIKMEIVSSKSQKSNVALIVIKINQGGAFAKKDTICMMENYVYYVHLVKWLLKEPVNIYVERIKYLN